MVSTMYQLSSTTTYEDLQLAATSITDIVGNLLQVHNAFLGVKSLFWLFLESR